MGALLPRCHLYSGVTNQNIPGEFVGCYAVHEFARFFCDGDDLRGKFTLVKNFIFSIWGFDEEVDLGYSVYEHTFYCEGDDPYVDPSAGAVGRWSWAGSGAPGPAAGPGGGGLPPVWPGAVWVGQVLVGRLWERGGAGSG